MVSTAGKTNSIHVKDNHSGKKKKKKKKKNIFNGRKKYNFNWRGKEIVILLEKIYFSYFFVPFHAIHTLQKVFQNDLCCG